ncbi:MAG: indolepyruvate ferredoxin oxidoreductase subunit alpha [Promethearchaeota archaeon]
MKSNVKSESESDNLKDIPYFSQDNTGKKGILFGNEAIARGLLEAGVQMGAGYPGTPSSDILPTLAEMAKYTESDIQLEWSVNEKVGFEVAYAGSMSNVRSVAVMKHVGLNVAADSFMTAAYMGARGGFVVISADDPSQYSSQNEQDNRYYGLHALVPVFEPSSPQEAKDMIKYAFQFSEEYKTIVLFRTTTRLNHGRGNISLGEIEKLDRRPEFDWDRTHWVCVPSNTRPQRKRLLERLEKIESHADKFPFNSLRLSNIKIKGKKYGFVASGIAYATLMDVLSHFELMADDFTDVSVLKIGMANPLPKKLMKKLLLNVDYLLVVEELEPIYEQAFKMLAFELGISKKIEIHGKEKIPQIGELSAEVLLEIIGEIIGKEFKKVKIPQNIVKIPTRFPQLCPGCSHRHTFYALNNVAKKIKKKFINCTDIGCYTLGQYKPLEVGDTGICMGSSIGLANGFSKLMSDEYPVIALIGDSTFFHTGVPGLINAVYNQNDLLVIVLDNSSTAMTGGQDNPGTGKSLTGKEVTRVLVENVAKGCGVPPENIWVQDSNNLPELEEKLEEAIKAQGVRVLVSRHVCSLIEMRQFRAKGITPALIKVDPEKCIGCQICIKKFGCPAIIFDFETQKARIDQIQCRSCKVCIDVCPQKAFYIDSNN